MSELSGETPRSILSFYLIVSVFLQEVARDVAGENVPEHVLVVFTQLSHLIYLFLRLYAPQEVQTSGVLKLRATERKRKVLVRKRIKSSRINFFDKKITMLRNRHI